MQLMDAHRQWASRPADQRFETLQALREAVHQRRMKSRAADVELPLTKVEVKDDTIVINSRIAPSEPTHWSFNQLSGWVKAPAAYLRTLPTELIARCINTGIEKADKQTLKFMTIEGDDRNVLQAVTSQTYGRIWDADVVDMTSRLVERSGGRFHNPKAYAPDGSIRQQGLYASDRDVFIFMIDGGSRLEVNDRAKLHRGFFLWNSEVGSKTFGLTTFLFNEVCGNHILYGAQSVNKLVIRHTKNGPNRFDSDAYPQLLAHCDSSTRQTEETIKKAAGLLIGKDDDEVSKWLHENGEFTKTEVREAIRTAKVEEGDCRTLWHAVQGFTAHARGYEFVDARIDLETRAGKLLEIVGTPE